jgi:hypothetical protein
MLMLSSRVLMFFLASAQDKAYRAFSKKACCVAAILEVDYIRMRLYIRSKIAVDNDMDETSHVLNQRQNKAQSANCSRSSIDPDRRPGFSSPLRRIPAVHRILEKTGLNPT